MDLYVVAAYQALEGRIIADLELGSIRPVLAVNQRSCVPEVLKVLHHIYYFYFERLIVQSDHAECRLHGSGLAPNKRSNFKYRTAEPLIVGGLGNTFGNRCAKSTFYSTRNPSAFDPTVSVVRIAKERNRFHCRCHSNLDRIGGSCAKKKCVYPRTHISRYLA